MLGNVKIKFSFVILLCSCHSVFSGPTMDTGNGTSDWSTTASTRANRASS